MHPNPPPNGSGRTHRQPFDWSIKRFPANRNEKVAIGDGEIQGHPTIETRRQLSDQLSIDQVDLECVESVNPLALDRLEDRARIPMRIDHDAWGRFAGLV